MCEKFKKYPNKKKKNLSKVLFFSIGAMYEVDHIYLEILTEVFFTVTV